MENRKVLFEKFYAQNEEKSLLTKNNNLEIEITILIPSNSPINIISKAFTTSPYSLLQTELRKNKYIKKHLPSIMIAKIDNQLWDLSRPIPFSCTLIFPLLSFDSLNINQKWVHPQFQSHSSIEDPNSKQLSKEALQVYWHSSAHILGYILETNFGGFLQDGPPISKGFFYDILTEKNISTKDFNSIKEKFLTFCDSKEPIKRLELTPVQARQMFIGNKYKEKIISMAEESKQMITAYNINGFVDLCKGPHIYNTEIIKSVIIRETGVVKKDSNNIVNKDENKISSKIPKTIDNLSLLQKKSENINSFSIQRVYAISFPKKSIQDLFISKEEESKNNEHTRLGTQMGLFFSHCLSPGSAFFTEKGTIIYRRLVNLMRSECIKRNYKEVISPNIFSKNLWETSGHYANYKDAMFNFPVEGNEFSLKPMNCPGHCLIFQNNYRRLSDLPLRMFEFGVLHRNELSGALTGLTRVRKFVQDDSHIFCTVDQIKEEIENLMDFIFDIYSIFGFSYKGNLSTRPEKSLQFDESGSLVEDSEINGLWEEAEKILKSCLDKKMHGNWELNEGDGAFYGPKIDFKLTDNTGKEHQCATVQLDFLTPRKFKLKYTSKDNKIETPVMLHRAILGSVERFIAVLLEHTRGRLPFWLSPNQVYIIPIFKTLKKNDEVSENENENESIERINLNISMKVEELKRKLEKYEIEVEVDCSKDNLNKKIVKANKGKWNEIVCVGENEVENESVSVRIGNKGRVIEEKEYINELKKRVKNKKW